MGYGRRRKYNVRGVNRKGSVVGKTRTSTLESLRDFAEMREWTIYGSISHEQGMRSS